MTYALSLEMRSPKAVISDSDINNQFIDKITKKILNKILKINTNFTVLDVACGAGRLSIWIAPRVKKVVGLDISSNMVDFARKNAIKTNMKNVEFFTIDNSSALKMFPDNAFDLVLSVWLLKYIISEKEVNDMVDQICRVTNKGGMVLVLDQMDDNNPGKLLSGNNDYSGQSILKSSSNYISLFESNGVILIKQYSAFNPKIIQVYNANIRNRLIKYKLFKLNELMMSLAININVTLSYFMKFHKRKVGHNILYFEKK